MPHIVRDATDKTGHPRIVRLGQAIKRPAPDPNSNDRTSCTSLRRNCGWCSRCCRILPCHSACTCRHSVRACFPSRSASFLGNSLSCSAFGWRLFRCGPCRPWGAGSGALQPSLGVRIRIPTAQEILTDGADRERHRATARGADSRPVVGISIKGSGASCLPGDFNAPSCLQRQCRTESGLRGQPSDAPFSDLG